MKAKEKFWQGTKIEAGSAVLTAETVQKALDQVLNSSVCKIKPAKYTTYSKVMFPLGSTHYHSYQENGQLCEECNKQEMISSIGEQND